MILDLDWMCAVSFSVGSPERVNLQPDRLAGAWW